MTSPLHSDGILPGRTEPADPPSRIDAATTSKDGFEPCQNTGIGQDPAAGREGQSIRIMVLGWCLWLIGSWMSALWTGSAVPAARWMLLATILGLTAVWPIVRLSLDPPKHLTPEKFVALEWLAMVGVLQAVIWPLAVTAGWDGGQAAWLDAAVMAWSMVSASVVVMGIGSDRAGLRVAAAALCMLLLFGEPLVRALLPNPEPGTLVMRVSPFQTLWALSGEDQQWRLSPWRMNVVVAAVAAGLAWVTVVATRTGTGPPSDSAG